MTTYYCPFCESWYNQSKQFKTYEVIFCPKCRELGELNSIYTQKTNTLFIPLRQLTELLTEIVLFYQSEIAEHFSKFEVLK